MAILVSNTKAGRSISAYIVMRENKHVATIQFHFSDNDIVRCDVYLPNKMNDPRQGMAGGYGYDKQTAAISGTIIDGYEIMDDGNEWERQLNRAGFTVYQAI